MNEPWNQFHAVLVSYFRKVFQVKFQCLTHALLIPGDFFTHTNNIAFTRRARQPLPDGAPSRTPSAATPGNEDKLARSIFEGQWLMSRDETQITTNSGKTFVEKCSKEQECCQGNRAVGSQCSYKERTMQRKRKSRPEVASLAPI